MYGYCWRKRHRCGRVGRMPKPIPISLNLLIERLDPIPAHRTDPIHLDIAEIEALRLIDLEKLTLEEAGEKMNISRNTVWRLVQSGREKLIRAIVEGRQIIIIKE
ncbi:MAG: DUF134 domain-containing protein [Nitrososphaerota archaeon]